MKKLGRVTILTLLIIILSTLLFVACDNGAKEKQVPVYKGMVISQSVASTSATTADDSEYVEPHHKPGHFEGDHDHRNDDFDQNKPFDDPSVPSIDDKAQSTLDVVGGAQNIYYADKNQDIYITIKLSNPDSYEILSFTLNGKKYSNYMFEDGSDMENLVLKVNVGNVGGIVEYTIDAIKYVDGTDIKDVRMDGDKTVKAGVRANDQTYVTVTNEQKSMTSISFDAKVVDSYSLIEKSGGYAKAVLYDGETMIAKDVTVGEKASVVFDNLTPNTVYQYGVVALYDDLSGNGVQLNTLYKKAVYTDTIVLFKDVQVGKESISWNFEWNQSFANKQMNAISLWQNGEKVQDVDVNATSVEGLKSNNEYTLKATYKNIQNQDETIEIVFVTYAKAVPSVAIESVESTQTEITFGLNVVDTDNVGAISKIELLHGNDTPIVATDLATRSFANLLSNNDYTIRVTYNYDLNDGVGEQQIVKTADIKTKAKAAPSVAINNFESTKNSISANVAFVDIDNIGEITSIVLKKDDTQIATTSERTHIVFDSLSHDTQYTIVITYKYDLNDGNGISTSVFSEKRFTAPVFSLDSFCVVNTSPIMSKSNIFFENAFSSSSEVSIKQIRINGEYYPASNVYDNQLIEYAILASEFQDGENEIIIDEIVFNCRGEDYSYYPTENNTASFFVNGNVTVKSISIISEDGNAVDGFVYANRNYFYEIVFENGTGYSITEVKIVSQGDYYLVETEYDKYYDKTSVTHTYSTANNSLYAVNKNMVRIPVSFTCGTHSDNITGIKYSNDNVGEQQSSGSFNMHSLDYTCLSNETPIIISSADDLNNLNTWGNYELGNDIDLNNFELNGTLTFSGILDGKGYKLYNIATTSAVENENISISLFNVARGSIKNLSLYGRIDVKVIATDTGYYSVSVVPLCFSAISLQLENVVNNIDIKVVAPKRCSANVGGLILDAYDTKLSYCGNNGRILGNADVGGLIFGLSYDTDATFVKCYNNGNITGGGIGGLLYHAGYDADTTFVKCYNNGNITGGCIGGLLYYAGSARFEECYNSGTLTAGGVGGLCSGTYAGASFLKCYNTGEINGGNGLAGGMACFTGDVDGSCIYIEECFNIGTIKGMDAGGFAAHGSAIIKDSYNAGSVTSSSYAGGFIGRNSGAYDGAVATLNISNSYNAGSVTSDSYAGGFVGYCDSDSNYGTTATLNISNSYNAGSVTSDSYAGGFVGYCNSEYSDPYTAMLNISSCYNAGFVTSNSLADDFVGYSNSTIELVKTYTTVNASQFGGEKKTLAEIIEIMKTIWDSTIWDFDNLNENGNPTLK